MLRKRVQLLKSYLSKKFPEIDINFYLSHRSNYIHMGLDFPLHSIKNYSSFIEEINNFLSKDLDLRFK